MGNVKVLLNVCLGVNEDTPTDVMLTFGDPRFATNRVPISSRLRIR